MIKMNFFKSIKGLVKPAKAIIGTLLKKPMTLKFPQESLEPVKGYRGRQFLDPKRCIGCRLCSMVCPNNAIEMVEFDGKKYPQIHLGRCCFCGLCAEKCLTKALTMTHEAMISLYDKSFAVYGPNKLNQPVEKR
jgi:formate hydrogenlyase subunit 6/NADH:ubiquinone oxidoreductase subunit I